jgi:tRNA (cmo5U34)-methyltransferase
MSEFDKKARDWDKNQMHVDRAQAIANALLKITSVNSLMKALEYGAGTGLLSFFLKDRFSEITLMDSSGEMIRVLQEKIVAENIRNMRALKIDLGKEEFKGEFDIIYNQMVLHHVENIESLFDKFYDLLKPGGNLVIADLFAEDGSFHGDGFSGHNGFDVDHLSNILKKKSFKDVIHKQCYIQKKEIEPGIIKEFPLFILAASK